MEVSAGAQSQAAPRRRWGDLGARAASGVVLVAVALVTAHQGGMLFVVTWAIAAIAVLWEWERLPGRLSIARLAIGVVALIAATIAARSDATAPALLILAAGTAALAATAESGLRLWSAGGLVYAGLLVVALVSLRTSFPFGSHAIIWLFATVWSTDVFAYFGGRLIGGPKLWPRVSPSKTWSGTLTGLAAGTLIGTWVVLRDPPASTPMTPIVLLSLATAALSQAGDAFESAIKRHFGVKDSSSLIPGHGGVMDRLDGFIAAAVFAFVFGMIRGQTTVAGGLFYWP